MRETEFIGQNKKKWSEFESVLDSEHSDAERLSRLFIETTDDLSFSRTYYPNRSVRVYLNGLAQKIYQRIYRKRKRERGAFARFWSAELPDAMWYARRELLASFLIFMGGMFIGMLSSHYAPEFVEIILGESYVQMTENNIERGDPMAVYKQEGPLESFLWITYNNVRVGMLCFLLGILFEVGSVFIVLSNAIMVGAFIWFFVQRDLFRESFITIMQHGSLELSMIVLSGAAGLALGRGLLFPGSYTRAQAFLLSARHGIKMMIGVSAFLVLAGFIEGFATRFTDAPEALRILVVLLSLVLVIGYFVWFPWYRHRLGLTEELAEKETMDERRAPIEFDVIKPAGKIVNEAWVLFSKRISSVVIAALLSGVLFAATIYTISDGEMIFFFDGDVFAGGNLFFQMLDAFLFWDEANNFFIYTNGYSVLFPLGVLCLTFILWIPQRTFHHITGLPRQRSNGFLTICLLNSLASAVLLLLPFWLNGHDYVGLATLVAALWWPLVLFNLAVAYVKRTFVWLSVGRSLKLLSGNFFRFISSFYLQVLILSAAMAMASAPLAFLIFDIIGTQFAASLPWADQLIFIVHTILMIFSLSLLIPVLIHHTLLSYFSFNEIATAGTLRAQISEIRFKKRAYGLEKEA